MGASLAFDDRGTGSAVVLIHGHPFNRSMWAPQQQALSSRFRVVCPDLRGYGESAASGGTVTLRELAADVEALLDELEIDAAAVVGLSMGGLVAMELAIASPGRWWALGLVATTAAPITDPERRERLATAERIEAEGPLGAAAALRGRAQRPDYREKLAELRIPTFVCAGTADTWSTQEVTTQLLSCLDAPRSLMLPGVGHLPNLKRPDAFNRELVSLLEAASPAGRAD